MVGDLWEHRSPYSPPSQTDAVTQATGDRGEAGVPLCGPETKVQARELGSILARDGNLIWDVR